MKKRLGMWVQISYLLISLFLFKSALGREIDESNQGVEETQPYTLSYSTIDTGGGRSSGGGFSLHGSIGQTDTALMIGEDFTLKGGFWPDPDLTNVDFVLFEDSFEDVILNAE